MIPNTFEKFENERDRISLDNLLGKKIDLSKLREICKNLNVEYDFKLDADDVTFWKACVAFPKQFFSK